MDSTAQQLEDEGMDLAALWRGLQNGHFCVVSSHYGEGRCWATVRRTDGHATKPAARAMKVLERVLIGERQKVLAYELGLTAATIAGYCSDALRSLACERLSSRAPILLVMAALASRGTRLPRARLDRALDDDGWLISVAMPGGELARRLSPSEWEVARATIEGKTHAEIASARGTSRRTVANQLAAVFGKLGASGRSELRAKAAAECLG